MMSKDTISIYAPELPESIMNATIINWHKKQGDQVYCDELLVDIETDKIILEVSASSNGILHKILKEAGDKILSKEVLGIITQMDVNDKKQGKVDEIPQEKYISEKVNFNFLSPKLRRIAQNNSLKTNDRNNKNVDLCPKETILTNNVLKNKNYGERTVHREVMSQLRKCIAERLIAAKNNMAMLTTFNEVNMQSIIQLRKQHGRSFKRKYNVKLGFMSFFVKSVAQALQDFPKVNASIDKEEIVYYNYFDISIAIATNRGLVTPVLKDVDRLSFYEIEKKIQDFKIKGNNKKLLIDDLIGGNCTITNGGIFGSLMSTPIVNPPQSAILGLHAIKNRPIAVNEEDIKIFPMMYLALSYDHRLIDGEDAVKFLARIKEIIEDYSIIMLDI